MQRINRDQKFIDDWGGKTDEEMIAYYKQILEDFYDEAQLEFQLNKWKRDELPKIKRKLLELAPSQGERDRLKADYDAACVAFNSSLPSYNPSYDIPDLSIKEEKVWLTPDNDRLLSALDARYISNGVRPSNKDYYFHLMERNIKAGLPRRNLDEIFDTLKSKTLVVDFENLNYAIKENNADILGYVSNTRTLNEFKNSLSFLLNYVINEDYSKLLIVTKTNIFDLFIDVFSNKDGDYYIDYISKLNEPSNNTSTEQLVYYNLTKTIHAIKTKIKEGSLKIQVVNVYNNFPYDSRYGENPLFIKLVKSFDDCTIVYIVDKLRKEGKDYKLISNDLKMFDDFNKERKIVLPFILDLHDLEISIDECHKFDGKPFNSSGLKNEMRFNLKSSNFIDTTIDPFFSTDIRPELYKPNQICSISDKCSKAPYINLQGKLNEHYFVNDKKLNHILRANIGERGNPSKYKAFFNIEKDKLLQMHSKFGFPDAISFNSAIFVYPDVVAKGWVKASKGKDYYYDKYLKYKSKYITLKNKLL